MSGGDVAAMGVAAVLSGGCTAVARPVLHHLRILDVPNARSTHAEPVVRGAGIGPLVAAVVVLLATAPLVDARWTGVVALAGAATFLGALGMADDLSGGLPIRVRLGGQLAVGVGVGLLVAPGHGAVTAGVAIACAVWVASSVNAVNFMDGINGITGVTAAVVGLAFAAIGAYDSTSALLAVGGMVMAGAALGFLPFNFPDASVFLGDVGSYFIGGWCAVLAVLALDAGAPLDVVVLPFALYLADTGSVIVRRVLRGDALGEPHRQHVYQRLVDGGVAVPWVTGLVGTCTVVLAGAGVVGWVTGERVATLATSAVVLVAYLLAPALVRPSERVAR